MDLSLIRDTEGMSQDLLGLVVGQRCHAECMELLKAGLGGRQVGPQTGHLLPQRLVLLEDVHLAPPRLRRPDGEVETVGVVFVRSILAHLPGGVPGACRSRLWSAVTLGHLAAGRGLEPGEEADRCFSVGLQGPPRGLL
jgi:hypothetical protein